MSEKKKNLQVNVTLGDATYALLMERSAQERRRPAQLARILLEDALHVSEVPIRRAASSRRA